METGKRRALGRGLGALIPQMPERSSPAGEPTPRMVRLADIQPNPVQPRQSFTETALEELAASIREKGILQPLLVRRRASGFELVAGERRLRAAQRAGLDEVPVIIRDVDDSELLEIALIENIQRENLNALEEARAYKRLADEFRLTQDEIATRVSKDRSTVANTLRLLQLPAEVQAAIESGELSAGHARALVSVASDLEKLALARQIISKKLSVRDAERLAKSTPGKLDADVRAAEESLRATLGTKVRLLNRKNGSGKIEIEYYSLDELNGLLGRLGVR